MKLILALASTIYGKLASTQAWRRQLHLEYLYPSLHCRRIQQIASAQLVAMTIILRRRQEKGPDGEMATSKAHTTITTQAQTHRNKINRYDFIITEIPSIDIFFTDLKKKKKIYFSLIYLFLLKILFCFFSFFTPSRKPPGRVGGLLLNIDIVVKKLFKLNTILFNCNHRDA